MTERIIFIDQMMGNGCATTVAIPVSGLPSELARPLLRQEFRPRGRIIRKPRLLETKRLLYQYDSKDEAEFMEIDECLTPAVNPENWSVS